MSIVMENDQEKPIHSVEDIFNRESQASDELDYRLDIGSEAGKVAVRRAVEEGNSRREASAIHGPLATSDPVSRVMKFMRQGRR